LNVISPKKLIEVALPLDAINAAAAREKSIRHGHPSTLHLWWARRPLAAARAVLFAQLVHDPEDLWRCQNPGVEPNQQVRGHWTKARARLFAIIEDLVQWENTTNETVLEKARAEIRRSWRETCELNKDHPDAATLFNPEKMPGLHDPFAGGGAIPLEAQRLGLEAFASDLNPVAVLINKAMIEIPPKFAGREPVNPASRLASRRRESADSLFAAGKNPAPDGAGSPARRGAQGLAEDVRYYGQWMRDEAFKRIGHLYPPIEITKAMVQERPDLKPYEGEKLTVIAWLWARTVRSPNPAFSHVEVPLASTFILSSKEGKEAYVQPVVGKSGYAFTVKVGKPPAEAKAGTKAARGSNFRCLMSGSPISADYIMTNAKEHGLGTRLLAIVAEGKRGRVYLSPTNDVPSPAKMPDLAFLELDMTNDRRWFSPPLYGMPQWKDIFTPRQLVALTTFSDLVGEARERIRRDAVAAHLTDDDTPLDAGGTGARAYAEAVSVYLGCVVDNFTESHSSICTWSNAPKNELIVSTFRRQALPMTWDFGEANAFADSSGSFTKIVDAEVKVIGMSLPGTANAIVAQSDSQRQQLSNNRYVSTDPPYYDNIGYADLSDFFYVWLRRSLRPVFPNLLATIAVPKAEELVATPYRHGTKQKAEKFFLDGMTQAMHNLAVQAHPAAPITIYYAFKQSETESTEGTSSSGWVTFLDAVLKSGLSITGTWPMRTERAERSVSLGTNSLASSIILVCRPRAKDAGTVDRRRFQRLLNETLPLALDAMTRESEGLHSPVAPVDLSQAIIGPGMAIFSRYDAVLEANGDPMTVKTALQLINRFLAEDDFDADTQFCLHWFTQHGWEAGKFGEADTLARAKGTSVEGVRQAGVIQSGGGNVRLFRWRELDAAWDPAKDPRIPVWQVLHQMILSYQTDGDSGAAKLYAALLAKTEAARQLAYRLYTLCERRGWAEDARAYNEVVAGWSGIESAASRASQPKQPMPKQVRLSDGGGDW
jgi:putative DNA methylase